MVSDRDGPACAAAAGLGCRVSCGWRGGGWPQRAAAGLERCCECHGGKRRTEWGWGGAVSSASHGAPRQARLDATARESLRVAAELGAVCAALAAPPCAPATNSDSLPWQLAPPARPDFNVFTSVAGAGGTAGEEDGGPDGVAAAALVGVEAAGRRAGVLGEPEGAGGVYGSQDGDGGGGAEWGGAGDGDGIDGSGGGGTGGGGGEIGDGAGAVSMLPCLREATPRRGRRLNRSSRSSVNQPRNRNRDINPGEILDRQLCCRIISHPKPTVLLNIFSRGLGIKCIVINDTALHEE